MGNKKNPRFSIIVPVYNIAEFVPCCIDSILSQTYTDFELIIVDDGSTDGSETICDSYLQTDDRIKVIHKKNGGLVSARKSGCLVAKGEYAVCIDGDDWVSKSYLQHFENAIQNYNPDIVCCGFSIANGNVYKDMRIPYESGYYNKEKINDIIIPELLNTNRGISFPKCLIAKAFKTELYVKIQMMIDNRISMGEDAACTIPCIFKSNSMYLDEACLYFYRVNPNSITHSAKPFDWKGPVIRLNSFANTLDTKDKKLLKRVNQNILFALFTVCCSQYRDARRTNKEIRRDISRKLREKEYREILQKSGWCGWKLNYRRVILLLRLYPVMRLFCKYKL